MTIKIDISKYEPELYKRFIESGVKLPTESDYEVFLSKVISMYRQFIASGKAGLIYGEQNGEIVLMYISDDIELPYFTLGEIDYLIGQLVGNDLFQEIAWFKEETFMKNNAGKLEMINEVFNDDELFQIERWIRDQINGISIDELEKNLKSEVIS